MILPYTTKKKKRSVLWKESEYWAYHIRIPLSKRRNLWLECVVCLCARACISGKRDCHRLFDWYGKMEIMTNKMYKQKKKLKMKHRVPTKPGKE